MNKAQLVEAMAKDAGITQVETKKVLNSFLRVATKALQEGDKLTLVGFGTFSIMDRMGREGRNPRTGAPIKIDAKRCVKFKPGMDLLRAVEQK